MQQEREKTKRGGKREGAGRPSGGRNTATITIRIPEDVEKILSGQDNKSAYIIEAIRAYDEQRRKKTIIGFEISYTKKR